MWKDFFYFSKSQRTGLIVLIILILGVITATHFLPLLFKPVQEDNTAFFEEVEQFKKSLQSRDSLLKIEREKRQAEYANKYPQKNYQYEKKEDSYTLFAFNPNIADSATFVQLGLKPYIASNIIKYRNKGGKFNNADDFEKIYGISAEKYNELKPYINIPRAEKSEETIITENTELIKNDIIVELNLTDTTELKQVEGIGSYLAKQIVKFRNETGGFVSVEQLMELPNMHTDNYERISPHCSVDKNLIRKIPINTASVERLKKHPYINFYQAKAIYEFRKAKGKINNINELKKLEEFTSDDLMRIEPYLDFN